MIEESGTVLTAVILSRTQKARRSSTRIRLRISLAAFKSWRPLSRTKHLLSEQQKKVRFQLVSSLASVDHPILICVQFCGKKSSQFQHNSQGPALWSCLFNGEGLLSFNSSVAHGRMIFSRFLICFSCSCAPMHFDAILITHEISTRPSMIRVIQCQIKSTKQSTYSKPQQENNTSLQTLVLKICCVFN